MDSPCTFFQCKNFIKIFLLPDKNDETLYQPMKPHPTPPGKYREN